MNECTSEKIKASRYNHFVPMENGNRLAFNALTCGLAEMDPESYRKYCDLLVRGEINGDSQDALVADLKKGGFITPADIDELDAIRAAHYMARFGGNGFGLTIVPTYRCNFACDYCYESNALDSLSGRGPQDMSDEVCSRVIALCEKRVEEKSGLAVTWYGGEPLLAKPTIERLTAAFLKISKDKNCRYTAGIITNGYLLDEAALNWLKEMNVSSVQVTVDGPRAIHDSRRPLKSGLGTYDRILANLSNITADTPLKVSLRINIDRRNVSTVDEVLKAFKERGWHKQPNISVNFGHVLQFGASCVSAGSSCMGGAEFAKFLVAAYRIAVELGFRDVDYPSRVPAPCSAISKGSHLIEPNGDVQACWNTVGTSDKRIGTLTADGISYSPRYFKWLGWSVFGQPMGCDSCSLLPVCMGGCPYKSLYPDELEDSYEQACVSYKHNLAEMLKLKQLDRTSRV